MHVDVGAGDLCRQLDAPHRLTDDPVIGRVLGSGGLADCPVEAAAADQLGVRDFLRRIVGHAHEAVGHGEVIDPDAQSRGGETEQGLSRLGGGLADRRPAELERLAANGVALVRRPAGVALDDGDALGSDVELLRDDLRERRLNAGTQLDLAAEQGHAPVAADGQPGIDLVEREVRCGSRRRGGLGAQLDGQAEGDDEGAGGRQEPPSREGRRHRPRPFSPAPRAGPRGGCACACRSGRGCPRAPSGSATRSAAASSGAAPPSSGSCR